MKNTVTVTQPAKEALTVGKSLLAQVRRAFGLEQPSREEIRRRMRSKPGLYASLSPEALAYLRDYDGPENLGPPLSRKERRSRG